jgi:hypothetical protein
MWQFAYEFVKREHELVRKQRVLRDFGEIPGTTYSTMECAHVPIRFPPQSAA